MKRPSTNSKNLTPRRQWAALAVLMLPVLLVSIDNTVLSFALPSIARQLLPDATTQLWIIDIYPLVLAALLVTMGSLGDRFGRRRLLMIGSSGFAVVSVVAAFAPNAEFLVISRGALGLFGAMLMPSTLSLLRSVFPEPNRRRLAIAIWASGFAAGSSLGPIVGGALLQIFPWGSVFLIALPMLIPLLILAPVLVPESKDPHPGPMDFITVACSFIAMLGVVWSIKSIAHDGFTAFNLAAGIIGIAAGVVFVRRQLKSENPLLDMHLFRSRPFTTSILANFLSVLGLISFVFFVSQHLQLVLGLSPLGAGLVMLPGAIVSIVAGFVAVRLVRWMTPPALITTGLLFLSLGFGLVILMRHDLTVAAVILSFCCLELGVGMSQTISNDTIVSSVPLAKAGAASAISETAYELGAVLGTATLGTMLTYFYRRNVVVPGGVSPLDAKTAGETLSGAASVAKNLPVDAANQLMTSARAAFDSGVGMLAISGAALTLIAAIVVVLASRHSRVSAGDAE